jgi:heptosyltransferase-2
MELLGVSSPAYRFGMSVPKTVKDFSFCKNAIGINASIMASVRSIPPDYVKEIVDQLKTFNGLSVVLFGKSNPWNKYLLNIKTNKRVINLIDRLTMPEMVSVISKLSLLIAPDSGPLHIAAALRKKTLGLFGNINPATRISHYNTVTALYPKKELDCVPCWDMHPCTGSAEYNPKDGSACMRLLTPDRAVKAAIKLGGF